MTVELLALSVWVGGLIVLIGAVIPAVFNTFGGQDSGGFFLTRTFEGYNRLVMGAMALLAPALGYRWWTGEPMVQVTRGEVIILALMGMMKETGKPGGFVREIFHAFWDAMMLAVLAGALWARLLAWLKGQRLSYMLTMAAILVLYYVAEMIGANGAITILLFGLILSNMEFLIGRMAKPIRVLIGYELDQAKFVLDEFLKRINEELSFLVRTFFYVLLGLILDFSALTASIAVTSLGFFAIVVVVRGVAAEVCGRMTDAWTGKEKFVIAAMFPRGVATAVMAFLPIAWGIPDT